jgi:RNA polymerase sigma-70 factor (ECF subfamily)
MPGTSEELTTSGRRLLRSSLLVALHVQLCLAAPSPIWDIQRMVPPDRLTYLFATYHAPLVRFLTRRVGDSDWAEEIAQETFVRAMKQETITSERSWLFAVATNLVRDEARRDARHRRRLELMREEAKSDAVVAPAPTSMEKEDDRRMARAAIEQLAERDREALLMREEGLSYDEIAAALELSVGSVGTTLSRARRRLMEAYEALQTERSVRPA